MVELEWILKDTQRVMGWAGGRESAKHYGRKVVGTWQRIVLVPIWLQKMTQVKLQQKNLDVVNGKVFDIRLLLCH